MTEEPQEPAPEPTVSTAPPPRRRIPSHLGPARTSTVVLAVLWLALGTLYLNVRPPTPAPAGSAGPSVEATDPGRATTAPATTSAPPTTATTTTETGGASTTTDSTTSGPLTSAPGETTAETTAPPTTLPTTAPTVAPTS